MKSNSDLITESIANDDHVQITRDMQFVRDAVGTGKRQEVALQLCVVDTGYIERVMLGNATYLRDTGIDSGFRRLEDFVKDIWNMNYTSILSTGIKNPDLLKDLSLAYFTLNHRHRSFDGWVLDWHLLVEKVGMQTFFAWVADGHSFQDIKSFADNDIDPELVRAYSGTTRN